MKWSEVTPNEALPFDFPYRVPPDLKHVVSETTLMVLESGNVPAQPADKKNGDDVGGGAEGELAKLYRRILKRPVVKKDVQHQALRLDKPTLDISLPHVCSPKTSPFENIAFHSRPLITDSSLQSFENSSHSPHQPSANHSQVLGDEQSSKFAVLFPRAGRRFEDEIK